MELSNHMNATRSTALIGDLAGVAIRHWLADEKRKHESIPAREPSLVSGYQWKRVFLPDGTLVRTIFKGRPRVAQVANDQLLVDGEPTSPNEFVNSTGGAPRNAWKSIWLLFPGEREWKLADDCRPSCPVRSTGRANPAT
jgi:hypothetical protein